MSHSLNKMVIAEGVETQEQYSFLEREGCDAVQGYLFSPPVSPDDVPAMVVPPGAGG